MANDLGIQMADGIFAAIVGKPVQPPPQQVSNWTPLINLVGERNAENFMFMGDVEGMNLYKHINTRRYLNIDRITGQTYAHMGEGRYAPITVQQALEWVMG